MESDGNLIFDTIETSFLRTMASYVIWNFVQSVVPYMSHVFRSALLEYQKETIGTKSAPPRWYSCIEDENGYYHGLTFALGYIWISKVFDVEIIPFVSTAYHLSIPCQQTKQWFCRQSQCLAFRELSKHSFITYTHVIPSPLLL